MKKLFLVAVVALSVLNVWGQSGAGNTPPKISLAGSSLTACEGSEITLVAAAGCSFGASNSHTLTLPSNTGGTTVLACMRVTDVDGQTDSVCFPITVLPAPAAPTLTGDGTYCDSAALSCFGVAGYTYQLQDSQQQEAGAAQVGADALLVFPITATGVYTVKVTDNTTGCESAAATATVTLEATPTHITLTPASDTVCEGEEVTLTATAGAASYNFNNAGWQPENTATVTVNANSTYTVKASSPSGCESAAASATVATRPAVGAASISGDASNSCPTTTDVTLTATAAAATSFTWYKDNTPVHTAAAATYAATATGHYTVRGRDAHCMGAVSAAKEVTINHCCNDGNCAAWIACPGFSLISNVASEGTMNWSSANSFCQNKGDGWRLPTILEFECICANKESLPGNFVNNFYWSSSGDYDWTRVMNFSDCYGELSTTWITPFNIKCVK